MKMGTGQLISLAMGIFLLSLGGGLVGGRLAAQKYLKSLPEQAKSAVASSEPSQSAEAKQPIKEKNSLPATPELFPPEPISKPHPKPDPAPAVKLRKTGDVEIPAVNEHSRPAPLKYAIQVLSTQQLYDARVAEGKIKASGFPVLVFEVDLESKGKWYRVCVGPYKGEGEARLVLNKVRGISGFQESFLKTFDPGKDRIKPLEGKELRK